MTVDISALGQLSPSQPLDLSDYPTSRLPERPAKQGFTLAPAGEYDLRAPDTFPVEAFTKSQKGSLIVKFDAPIVGGEYDGTVVRYISASATSFPREVNGVVKQASFMADLVKSAGVTGEFPGVDESGSAQAQADMVAQIVGRNFRAKLDWEARDRKYGSGTKLRGMYKFPKNADGSFQPYIELADVRDDQGRPARVWANLVVTSFLTT